MRRSAPREACPCGETAVVSVAPLPKHGDNVEPTCGLGKRESPCGFRAVGWTKGGTASVETTAHVQGESQDRLKGGERAIVRIGGPHGLTTGGAIALERRQELSFGGGRSGGSACHSRCLHEWRDS